MVVHNLIEDWIAYPRIDGGFTPADASFAETHAFRERAVLYFPVQRRSAEPRPIEDGVESKDAIVLLGHVIGSGGG